MTTTTALNKVSESRKMPFVFLQLSIMLADRTSVTAVVVVCSRWCRQLSAQVKKGEKGRRFDAAI